MSCGISIKHAISSLGGARSKEHIVVFNLGNMRQSNGES